MNKIISLYESTKYRKKTKDVTINGWLDYNEVKFAQLDSIDVTSQQNKGVGKREVMSFEKWSLKNKAEEVRIEAEENVIDFWLKLNYEILERGDVDTPTTMVKKL